MNTYFWVPMPSQRWREAKLSRRESLIALGITDDAIGWFGCKFGSEVDMTEMNPDQITGSISITVLPQDNGQYICQISSSLGELSRDCTRFYGQTKEHALANALEQLADDYRQIAEESQNRDWDAVERSDSGVPIEKHYHVILHYERIISSESKFEAMHNTILGNTVVEDAKISVIEISPDLQINPLTRS